MMFYRFYWLIASFVYMLFLALAVSPVLGHLVHYKALPPAWILITYDALFCLGVISFLIVTILYIQKEHPHGGTAYPGPFVVRVQKNEKVRFVPCGLHPGYLVFAFMSACIIPLVPVFMNTASLDIFIGYELIFIFQVFCELKGFRKYVMAPAVPIAFSLYRFWQLVRGMLAFFLSEKYQSMPFLFSCLAYELCFWTVDYGVVMAFLPLTYNYNFSSKKP